MSIRTLLSSPKQPLHLLKHHRYLSAIVDIDNVLPTQPQPQTPPNITSKLIHLLNSINTDNWNDNDELRQLLSTINTTPPTLIQLLRRLGTSAKALKLYQWVQTNVVPISPSLAYQAIFEIAAREPDSCLKLLDVLELSRDENVALTVESVAILVRSFARAQMVDEVRRVFNEIQPCNRTTYICNVLLALMFRGGNVDDSLVLLDEMLQLESESESGLGYPPNDSTGFIVFAWLLREKTVRPEMVVSLVFKLGDHGVFPDGMTIMRLITKLGHGSHCSQAWELLNGLMKIKEGPVDAQSCNAMLTWLGRTNDFQKMNLLMAEMKEKGIRPNVVTFGVLVMYLCKSRRVDEALRVLNEMTKEEENGEGFFVRPDVVIYNTLFDGLCKVGRPGEALALMQKMRLQNVCAPTTVTYNCLIYGFCKSGEIESSIELFDQMKEEGVPPNIITVNTLVDGMCKHGRIGTALKFFNDMQINGIKGDTVTYTSLINAHCRVNNIDKAMALFDEMMSAKCTPDAIVYYTLISGLIQAGQLDDAISIVGKMKASGFCLDAVSYNVLINGFCKENRMDKVSEIFKEMELSGIRPDEVTYNTIISSLGKSGDFNTATETMKKMIGEGLVPTVVTFGALIHGYCIIGKLDVAMTIFENMRSTSKVSPNTVIYNILIDSLCKENKTEVAVSLMDEMQVKGVVPNVITYNAMFRGLQEKKWLDKALEMMDRMQRQACNPDYVTMEILTEWFSAVGEMESLRNFVQEYQVSASLPRNEAKLR
ncbi:hypothetical protein GIB67_029317 [Kingdonia uniflora]|uniref:Pentatricopeptide repeat-containing protein n=1 Tax=Kingdonia uniflora TaxID=39325 RepID=A0A7J7N9A5_9MAGN|nr:hypothetical protein GIB67_029317 [Kingdonia uniflora]